MKTSNFGISTSNFGANTSRFAAKDSGFAFKKHWYVVEVSKNVVKVFQTVVNDFCLAFDMFFICILESEREFLKSERASDFDFLTFPEHLYNIKTFLIIFFAGRVQIELL